MTISECQSALMLPVQLPFQLIYNNQVIMGTEMSANWLPTVQPLTSSYIERESFYGVSRSGVLDPTSPTELMKNLSSPPPAQTNMDEADYLASLLQDDGNAYYRYSCLDDYNINLDNECSPYPDNESPINVPLLDPYFRT
jgi:hypothetical protein